MTGAALIVAERQRQIEAEGWSAEHDDKHDRDEMLVAAAMYATPEEWRDQRPIYSDDPHPTGKVPNVWPWETEAWKPSPHDRIRELVKAGALLAAEIDRLERNPLLRVERHQDPDSGVS